jgi:hypothetical protein
MKVRAQNTSLSHSKSIGMEIRVQAWAGPEGSRSMRRLDFKTIGT